MIVFQPDAKRKIWFQPCPDQLPVRLPGRSPVLCSPRRPHHRHPRRGRRDEKSFVSQRKCVFLLSRCHNRIIIFMIVVFHRRHRLRFYQSSRCFYRHGVRWAEAPGTRLSLSRPGSRPSLLPPRMRTHPWDPAVPSVHLHHSPKKGAQ